MVQGSGKVPFHIRPTQIALLVVAKGLEWVDTRGCIPKGATDSGEQGLLRLEWASWQPSLVQCFVQGVRCDGVPQIASLLMFHRWFVSCPWSNPSCYTQALAV